MSVTFTSSSAPLGQISIGVKGRIVLPAAARRQHHWQEGTNLVIVDTPEGVLLTTEAGLEKRVITALRETGPVVDEFIAERRQATVAEADA